MNSMAAYPMEKKTTEMILVSYRLIQIFDKFIFQTEKEYADYNEAMVSTDRGQPRHLFMGHGLNANDFEKREFASLNQLAYGEKKSTEQIIHPKVYQSDAGMNRSQISVNAKTSEAPALFKTGQDKLAPRSYNQFTKKFDNNSLNLKLRQ